MSGKAAAALLLALAAQSIDPAFAAPDATLCASCHGKAGQPADDATPVIWGQKAAYLEKELRDFKGGDRESQIMSSMAESVGDGDVAALAQIFAKSSWPKREDTAAAKPALDASLEPIVQTCRSCHVDEPNSADHVAIPRLAGQSSAYLAASLDAFANGERANSDTMTAIASSLDSKQRAALARYFSAL